MRVYVGDVVVFAKDINTIDSIIFVEAEPTSIIDKNGVLKGEFSIGVNKKVRFTRGNLQYQASTGIWRFAEHQFDYVGNSSIGNVYNEDSIKSNNNKISATYNGWIDLFGWGASGYSGSRPYESVFNTSLYGNPGTNYIDLTNTNYDWGSYCVISNGGNQAGLWHTLDTEEWKYLFHTRGNANYLRGFACIDGHCGYVLLPDNWAGVTSPSFTPNVANYTTNVYTLSEWEVLENAGAVFLPAAGARWETETSSANSICYYWSATANVSASADRVKLSPVYGVVVDDYAMRNTGQAVRLVQFVANEQ